MLVAVVQAQTPTAAPTSLYDNLDIYPFSVDHSNEFIAVAACIIVLYTMFGMYFRWVHLQDEKDAKAQREASLRKANPSPDAAGNPLHRSRSSSRASAAK